MVGSIRGGQLSEENLLFNCCYESSAPATTSAAGISFGDSHVRPGRERGWRGPPTPLPAAAQVLPGRPCGPCVSGA